MNIPTDCDNKKSKEYKKVYEITSKQVPHWPRKGKILANRLSVNYDVFHRIGVVNWVPTNHTLTIATCLGKFVYIVGTKTKFDFGYYVFEQTLKYTSTFAVKMPITFPSLICGIILSQHPEILISSDAASKRESPLSLHYRLFAGTHVPNIVMTSYKETSRSTSKDGIIAELKDTCEALDETIKTCTTKKIRLERLIKALTQEGIDVMWLVMWKKKMRRM